MSNNKKKETNKNFTDDSTKMFIPEHFINKSKELELVKKYPFATLISVETSEQLEITKIPLLLKQQQGEFYLEGHLAKANPHRKTLDKHAKVTVMFDAAHGYISPNWYSDSINNVPTWNFSTVIVQAESEIIKDIAWIKNSLIELSNHFEKDTLWSEAVNKNYFSTLLKVVVGVKLKIISLKSKFKLSQNRLEIDKENIIEKLSMANKNLADDMRNWT